MTAQFQHGLFDCLDDCGLCCITCMFPCYTFGKNAEAMGDECILWGLIYMLYPLNIFGGAYMRYRLREKYGIVGNIVTDLVYHWLCPCCSLVQESRELSLPRDQTIKRY